PVFLNPNVNGFLFSIGNLVILRICNFIDPIDGILFIFIIMNGIIIWGFGSQYIGIVMGQVIQYISRFAFITSAQIFQVSYGHVGQLNFKTRGIETGSVFRIFQTYINGLRKVLGFIIFGVCNGIISVFGIFLSVVKTNDKFILFLITEDFPLG